MRRIRRRKTEDRRQNGIRILLFCILCSVFRLLSLHSEIIDRIAAVVDSKIITTSDIRKERALASVFGDTVKDDQALLQDLIERALVEGQITQFPDIEVTVDEVDEAVRSLAAPANIPSGELRDAVRRRILRARYFEFRFRQFIRATDEEVEKYYSDVFAPEARSRGLNPIPTLDQATETIRANIIDEKMSQEVQGWLETVRRRSDVEIFK